MLECFWNEIEPTWGHSPVYWMFTEASHVCNLSVWMISAMQCLVGLNLMLSSDHQIIIIFIICFCFGSFNHMHCESKWKQIRSKKISIQICPVHTDGLMDVKHVFLEAFSFLL